MLLITFIGNGFPLTLPSVPARGKITALKQELQSSRMASYLTDFDSTVEDHTLIVGSVPLQEIQEEERRQREERVKAELEVRTCLVLIASECEYCC